MGGCDEGVEETDFGRLPPQPILELACFLLHCETSAKGGHNSSGGIILVADLFPPQEMEENVVLGWLANFERRSVAKKPPGEAMDLQECLEGSGIVHI